MKARNDASALVVFALIAILSAAFHPAPVQQEPPPVEETRIGDVAEVSVIDEVKDANAENGWYKKTKGGWMFWPESTVEGDKPPKAELAAFMSGQLAESVAGLVVLALPFVLVITWKLRKRKKANDRDMKRISGVSQAEFQALIRKLSGMEQILHNLTPENGESRNGGRKRWI